MMASEHDVKLEGMHGHNHHSHHQTQHLGHHDSRSPSNDGEHENGEQGDHLHELQSQQVIRKMDRPSVVNINNIKTE